MADLVITATSVLKGTLGVSITGGVLGETVTAGQALYLKASDGKWYKAQANGTAELAGSGGFGVALNGGAVNQPVQIQTGGQITIGATVAAGVFYYLSKLAAGGIGPVGDLVSTNLVTVVGYGLTTSTLQIQPVVTGLALA